MSQSPTRNKQPPPCDAQGISKWTRAYAQNRTLGVMVFLMISVVLCVAIGGLSFLGGMAFRSGNMLLFWVSIAVLVPTLGALVYLSVPKWGGKFQERVVNRLYAREGNVALSAPGERKKIGAMMLVGCFGTCIIASVVMSSVLNIPTKYMQPISALYVAPFLVGLWCLMRPMAGSLALLWPALYAIHAILIVAGAPILFTGPWEGLNMLVPIAGYGMLSAFVGHLYSRVALRRLKRLTQAEPTGADRPKEVSG
jgi:hypothetical protein